jgi:hypothetical protein
MSGPILRALSNNKWSWGNSSDQKTCFLLPLLTFILNFHIQHGSADRNDPIGRCTNLARMFRGVENTASRWVELRLIFKLWACTSKLWRRLACKMGIKGSQLPDKRMFQSPFSPWLRNFVRFSGTSASVSGSTSQSYAPTSPGYRWGLSYSSLRGLSLCVVWCALGRVCIMAWLAPIFTTDLRWDDKYKVCLVRGDAGSIR